MAVPSRSGFQYTHVLGSRKSAPPTYYPNNVWGAVCVKIHLSGVISPIQRYLDMRIDICLPGIDIYLQHRYLLDIYYSRHRFYSRHRYLFTASIFIRGIDIYSQHGIYSRSIFIRGIDIYSRHRHLLTASIFIRGIDIYSWHRY